MASSIVQRCSKTSVHVWSVVNPAASSNADSLSAVLIRSCCMTTGSRMSGAAPAASSSSFQIESPGMPSSLPQVTMPMTPPGRRTRRTSVNAATGSNDSSRTWPCLSTPAPAQLTGPTISSVRASRTGRLDPLGAFVILPAARIHGSRWHRCTARRSRAWR